MNTDNLNSLLPANKATKSPNPRLGIVFIVLVTLDSLITPLLSLLAGSDEAKYANYIYVHTIIAYTIIVISILIFHKYGLDVFQDHFSLWLIVFTCFFRPRTGGPGEHVFRAAMDILGLVLSGYIIANRKRIKIPNWKSILIGVSWSVGTVIVGTVVHVLESPSHATLPPYLTLVIFYTSVYQLSFTTVIEEAYCRGLLYGFLVMNGVKENTALWIQAIFFCLNHYFDIIQNPLLFIFGVVPIVAISTTLIIKKYKMLYQSIMIHTLMNVFVPILILIL